MFKILYRLDDLDTVEANLVAEAANRLGVGEFQLFRLAHRAWHGAEVEAKALEPDFLGYMLRDDVPFWVRQYARKVVAGHEQGMLDPEDATFHAYDHTGVQNKGLWSGIAKVALVALMTAVLMGLILYTYSAPDMETARCMFPPCPWYH